MPEPIQPLDDNSEDSGVFAVWNKTLLRYEPGTHHTKTAAQEAMRALRDGHRKGHKLEVVGV